MYGQEEQLNKQLNSPISDYEAFHDLISPPLNNLRTQMPPIDLKNATLEYIVTEDAHKGIA